ncbi:MAG: hypothetical protein IKH20_09630 [Clostridiales bacterium]|nr:hypothetical protein [Clostridiales bacterium]
MVELHGWITIRENYKETDEDNIYEIVDDINRVIYELGYPELKAKWMNGECCFQCSFYTNHWDGRIQDIINLYNLVAEKAIGSYGLLYVYDDESKSDNNRFVIYKLARGKIEKSADSLLSPCIPTVEDGI